MPIQRFQQLRQRVGFRSGHNNLADFLFEVLISRSGVKHWLVENRRRKQKRLAIQGVKLNQKKQPSSSTPTGASTTKKVAHRTPNLRRRMQTQSQRNAWHVGRQFMHVANHSYGRDRNVPVPQGPVDMHVRVHEFRLRSLRSGLGD